MATATHLVKISYYVSEEKLGTSGIKLNESAKWKMYLGDALENIEVEKLE